MSCQWMLTIWSVPDCFELFKRNVDKCRCGHSMVQTQHNPDSNGNSIACTEHNLGGRGSIVNSETRTGQVYTGFIHDWNGVYTWPSLPSWLYEQHRNANGNKMPQCDWGNGDSLDYTHNSATWTWMGPLVACTGWELFAYLTMRAIPSHPWLYCWHKRNSILWKR